jgi:hypothetical protein
LRPPLRLLGSLALVTVIVTLAATTGRASATRAMSTALGVLGVVCALALVVLTRFAVSYGRNRALFVGREVLRVPRGFSAGIPWRGDDELALASITRVAQDRGRWSIIARNPQRVPDRPASRSAQPSDSAERIISVADSTLPPSLPRAELWALVELRAVAARDSWTDRQRLVAEAIAFAAAPGKPAPIAVRLDGDMVTGLVAPGEPTDGATSLDEKIKPAVEAALARRAG